jgi:hypothetical protein
VIKILTENGRERAWSADKFRAPIVNFENLQNTIMKRVITVGDPNLSAVTYRTVPYRFPRGTVLVNRTAYRTFDCIFA